MRATGAERLRRLDARRAARDRRRRRTAPPRCGPTAPCGLATLALFAGASTASSARARRRIAVPDGPGLGVDGAALPSLRLRPGDSPRRPGASRGSAVARARDDLQLAPGHARPPAARRARVNFASRSPATHRRRASSSPSRSHSGAIAPVPMPAQRGGERPRVVAQPVASRAARRPPAGRRRTAAAPPSGPRSPRSSPARCTAASRVVGAPGARPLGRVLDAGGGRRRARGARRARERPARRAARPGRRASSRTARTLGGRRGEDVGGARRRSRSAARRRPRRARGGRARAAGSVRAEPLGDGVPAAPVSRRIRAAGRPSALIAPSSPGPRDTYLLLRALLRRARALRHRRRRARPRARARRRSCSRSCATARFRCFSHVDERSAGFFALGLAKATGRPAVAGLHVGDRGGRSTCRR